MAHSLVIECLRSVTEKVFMLEPLILVVLEDCVGALVTHLVPDQILCLGSFSQPMQQSTLVVTKMSQKS